MQIRRSIPADTKAIAEAEKLIFTDPWSERDINDTICSDGAMCYTALTDDGKLIAYVLGRKIVPEGEIYRIATIPEYRRRGVAYRLLSYATKTERGSGLETLFLEVREQNIPARSLYKSFGFSEIGVRKNYYKLPFDNAVVMLLSAKEDL